MKTLARFSLLAATAAGSIACGGSRLVINQGSRQPQTRPRAIITTSNKSAVADAIASELSSRGYNVLDTHATSSLIDAITGRPLSTDQANSLQEPDILTELAARNVDLIMTVQAKTVPNIMGVGEELLDDTKINFYPTGQTGGSIGGIDWKNSWGGMPGSPADGMMRKSMPVAAKEVADALVGVVGAAGERVTVDMRPSEEQLARRRGRRRSRDDQYDDAPRPVAKKEPPPPPRSDVDDVPAATGKPRSAHAVVIGIEHYRGGLPAAEFAANDARLVGKYLTQTLGFPEENVAVLVDGQATKSDFEKYFENWLPNRVEKGDEVFVYYSGHGAPDPSKGDAYLVPYDGDPTYLDKTSYPVQRMYSYLAKLPAGKVTVVLDSCFSGAGGRSVIASGARPLVNMVQTSVPAQISVLAAAGADEISNTYQTKGHGLFTYFFLKGLKDHPQNYKAAFDYLKPEVSRVARREFNTNQDPVFLGGGQ